MGSFCTWETGEGVGWWTCLQVALPGEEIFVRHPKKALCSCVSFCSSSSFAHFGAELVF